MSISERDDKGRYIAGVTPHNKGVYGSKRRDFENGLDVQCMHHGFHRNWYYSQKKNVLTCRFCQSERSSKYAQKEENTFKVFLTWAKGRDRECSVSADYLKELFNEQDGMCNISGMKLDRSNMSLDRINSEIGYVEGNLQWVHKKINQMKSNFDENEFVDICNKISNYNILKVALRAAGVKKK
jgi:hypothetical protein